MFIVQALVLITWSSLPSMAVGIRDDNLIKIRFFNMHMYIAKYLQQTWPITDLQLSSTLGFDEKKKEF